MTWESMKNILMVIFGAAGTLLATKGVTDASTATAVSGALITVIGAVWGYVKGTPVNVAINAANTTGIAGVVTTQAIADASPNAKNVVASADAATLTHAPTT